MTRVSILFISQTFGKWEGTLIQNKSAGTACTPGGVSPTVMVDRYPLGYSACTVAHLTIKAAHLWPKAFGVPVWENWAALLWGLGLPRLQVSPGLALVVIFTRTRPASRPSTWGWTGWNLGPQTRRVVCWSCVKPWWEWRGLGTVQGGRALLPG